MTAQEHDEFVTPRCTRCHRRGSLALVMNTGFFLLFRCTACRCEVAQPLPVVAKKIIYLDQMVISNIVKAKEDRWRLLHARLVELDAMQLIVCPFSEVHLEESMLAAEWRDRLKLLYRTIGGVAFRTPREIETAQLLTAIRSWLGSPGPSVREAAWEESFESDPHRWTADMNVFASFSTDEAVVTSLRESKLATKANMDTLCDHWRRNPLTFEQDCVAEIEGYARGVIEPYRLLAGGRRFDPRTPPGWHLGAVLVHRLACEVAESRPDIADPAEIVREFFASDACKAVPFLDISGRIWATIAQQARNPKGPRVPKPGDHYDVQVLSRHAPYCDAMIVDKEFRAVASSGNVDLPGRYGVRLFSPSVLDEFSDYLRDIEARMTPEHRGALIAVHSVTRPGPAPIAPAPAICGVIPTDDEQPRLGQ